MSNICASVFNIESQDRIDLADSLLPPHDVQFNNFIWLISKTQTEHTAPFL